ncbi:hypothetical protein TMEN_8984 [Trichophyton mentagrophytes]|uniref:Uncharacterized protein n=1 Tax=Trichophyton interdigitale (strain MR816) TaxID=1215338 RepID=A0A059IX66_TRIIM|nr:hypothetical protein H101_04832 [Trichophyton interdigitale H6]KDB20196.1 hypothetical protein H109_07823 [Trichophyton interdigitale MR816]GBF66264.1 hypothetical protein TMEN_8984 [Trichophyton mentagrophytes]
MEPTSSRDTLPMSSTTLSRVRRTLTAPESYIPQSSAHSMDELALPFPFEVAVPRYPPLHQSPATSRRSTTTTAAPSSYVDTGSLWEVPDDQPNEPSTGHQFHSTIEAIPEEHHELDTVLEGPEQDVDPISAIEEAPRNYENIHPEDQNVLQLYHGPDPAIDVEEDPGIQDDIVQGDENIHSVEPTDTSPEGVSPLQLQKVNIAEPEKRPLKRAKKSQKKKVRRGKTTSAVVRKTVESDVEDDVIWIDEKKSTSAIIDDTDASDDILDLNDNDNLFTANSLAHETEPVPKSLPKIEVQVQVPINITDKNGQVGPAPKKRGRKRKKTDQEDISIQKSPPRSVETIIPDNSVENHNDNDIPSVPPPPLSSLGVVKQQTPEPKADNHNLQTSVKNSESSIDKRIEPTPPVETPKKPAVKGPDKHSPISVTAKVAYRVGLSRKARIAPLLKVVRK